MTVVQEFNIMHVLLSRRECDPDVDQFGFVDLVDAMTNGIVPETSNTDEMSFDGENVSPDSVGRQVKNAFDAIDNLNSINPPE